MGKSLSYLLLALLLWAVPLAYGGGPTTFPSPNFSKKSGKVFDADHPLTLHLRFSAQNWKKMQPTFKLPFDALAKARQAGATQPAATQPIREELADSKRNEFGYQFPYVSADLEADGKVYPNVPIRFKGNSSYNAMGNSLFRPLKLDFDRYVPDRKFHGLSTVNLHNNAYDESRVREAVAYDLFRESGVPASRTGLAMVYITVPDEFDHELMGVYSTVEEVDETYLKTRFGSGSGLLLKPTGVRDTITYSSDSWNSYSKRYNPKSKVHGGSAMRFIAFARLVSEASDEEFARQIGDYLDVDAFLRFLAANVMLSNMDSLLVTGHNFYLYLDESNHKFYFIPWDLNLSFGGLTWVGNANDLMNLSIDHPHRSEIKLIDRLMAIDGVKKKYHGIVAELVKGPFAPPHMHQVIERATKQTQAAQKQVKPSTRPAPQIRVPLGLGSPSLDVFADQRAVSVLDQLAGKSNGHEPTLKPKTFFGFPIPKGRRNAPPARPAPTTRPVR